MSSYVSTLNDESRNSDPNLKLTGSGEGGGVATAPHPSVRPFHWHPSVLLQTFPLVIDGQSTCWSWRRSKMSGCCWSSMMSATRRSREDGAAASTILPTRPAIRRPNINRLLVFGGIIVMMLIAFIMVGGCCCLSWEVRPQRPQAGGYSLYQLPVDSRILQTLGCLLLFANWACSESAWSDRSFSQNWESWLPGPYLARDVSIDRCIGKIIYINRRGDSYQLSPGDKNLDSLRLRLRGVLSASFC